MRHDPTSSDIVYVIPIGIRADACITRSHSRLEGGMNAAEVARAARGVVVVTGKEDEHVGYSLSDDAIIPREKAKRTASSA
jgi:hypothetical protein